MIIRLIVEKWRRNSETHVNGLLHAERSYHYKSYSYNCVIKEKEEWWLDHWESGKCPYTIRIVVAWSIVWWSLRSLKLLSAIFFTFLWNFIFHVFCISVECILKLSTNMNKNNNGRSMALIFILLLKVETEQQEEMLGFLV